MIGKIVRAVKFKSKYHGLQLRHTLHNAFVSSPKKGAYTDSDEYNKIVDHAVERSDINEHLTTIFNAGMAQKPKLMVELGVRSGESTFVLEKVAKLCDATLVSDDLDPCINASAWKKWFFVQQDDITFAKEFPDFCAKNNISGKIDLLFIDTSHLYEHTVQEIASWFPLLADNFTVIFHDTNLVDVYHRNDGSIGIAWDNDRAVIRAIEEHYNTSFDESKDFTTTVDGVKVTHYANCCGLTILEKQ
ncbi:MAG: class I SAM-dependent methyltransferase [Vicingaceae bacterium]|nr:class I SAM-dependent methyltransferase [Vicingaceae bacterium]